MRVGGRWGAVDRFDSLDICLMAVAGMAVAAAVSAASVTWTPLGYLMAAVGIYVFPRVFRTVRRRLVPPDPDASAFRWSWMQRGWGPRLVRGWWFLRLVVLAALLSVPVTQVFFRGDLQAMATPNIAAEASEQPELFTGIPEAIYGPSPGFPSYATCQWVQGLVGATPAEPCYSAVGYLWLWQMPVALPTMVCLVLLYLGVPALVAVCVPRTTARRAQLRAAGSSKGST